MIQLESYTDDQLFAAYLWLKYAPKTENLLFEDEAVLMIKEYLGHDKYESIKEYIKSVAISTQRHARLVNERPE